MVRRCCLISVLLLTAWAARVRLAAPPSATDAESLSQFPSAIGAWTSRQELPLDAEVVKTAAVDDYLNRSYRAGTAEVGLYVGYYRSQAQGEALHSPLNCLPGAGWEPINTESLNVATAPAAAITVKKLVVQKGIDQMLVLYWYQTLNRVTGSEYARKFFLVADAFGYGRTDVALVRVIAPIDARDLAGEAKAISVARPFAAQVLPEIRKRLFKG